MRGMASYERSPGVWGEEANKWTYWAIIWGHPWIKAAIPPSPRWPRELVNICTVPTAFFAATRALWGLVTVSYIPYPSLTLYRLPYFEGNHYMLVFIVGQLIYSRRSHVCLCLSPYLIFFVVCCGCDGHLMSNLVVIVHIIDMPCECCDICNSHMVDLSDWVMGS